MFDSQVISFLAGFISCAVTIITLFSLFRFDFRSMSHRVDDIEDRVNSLEEKNRIS